MWKKAAFALLVLSWAVVFAVLPVRAGVVESVASGSGAKSDYRAIRKELNNTGYVRLVPGQTYDLGKSVLHVKSNWTIDASGATIIGKNCILLNIPAATGYRAIENFHIIGGTWIFNGENGLRKSAIKISHGSNISFSNMDIHWCNLNNHSIELVGCKDVKISGCRIDGLGSGRSGSVEEAIQIDLAAPKTAPFLDEYHAAVLGLWDGAPCENILIRDCWVRGCRGICANFAAKDAKAGRKGYLRKFHRNIVITGNTIIGVKSEGLAMFNVLSAKVRGNRIYSLSERKSSPYSTGCHFVLMGKIPRPLRRFAVSISGNVILGGSHAIGFNSHASTKYRKVIIKNNVLHCRKGKRRAFSLEKIKKLVTRNNVVR